MFVVLKVLGSGKDVMSPSNRPLSRRIPPPPPAGNVWRCRRRKKFGAPPSQPKLIDGAGAAGGAVPAERLRMDWYLRAVVL